MDAARRKSRHTMDMTQGNILKTLVVFSFPLLLGNLFQQFYNIVDTWVVGHYGAETTEVIDAAAGVVANDNPAYAAVGSVAPIINLLLGFFVGLSGGAGVVISHFFGAREEEKVNRAVHTAVAMTLAIGAALTVIGPLFTPYLLRLILNNADPADPIYSQGVTYLRIYFFGTLAMVLYNIGAAILRAVGDSRKPFYYLIVSALTNVALDLVFVRVLGMQAAGVAIATVISQGLSAVLTFITLMRSRSCVRFSPKRLRFDPEILRKIVRQGIPAAIQGSVTQFSNIFVQRYISNVVVQAPFTQQSVIGGWTSYHKMDQFLFLPASSMSITASTFVAQNIGVGNVKRARRGTLYAYLISTGVSLFLMIPTLIWPNFFGGLFNPDSAVTAVAGRLLLYLTAFYLLCSVNQVLNGAMRGSGNARAPMVIMITSFVVVRQIYLFVITHVAGGAYNTILPVAFSYPVGWITCAVITLTYYLHYRLEGKSLAGNP